MTEQQLTRQAQRRLAILRHSEEVTGNVARTCRYYGISRQCFYTWKRRYDDEGLDGLRDRSSRPHHSPGATRTDVVGKIVYLRQTCHCGAGRALAIATYSCWSERDVVRGLFIEAFLETHSFQSRARYHHRFCSAADLVSCGCLEVFDHHLGFLRDVVRVQFHEARERLRGLLAFDIGIVFSRL